MQKLFYFPAFFDGQMFWPPVWVFRGRWLSVAQNHHGSLRVFLKFENALKWCQEV